MNAFLILLKTWGADNTCTKKKLQVEFSKMFPATLILVKNSLKYPYKP